MANIRNWTYKGHNWIATLQQPGAITMTARGVSLLTDKEYREHKKKYPNTKLKHLSYRRLKETDRELVEFKFGKEQPQSK